MAAYSFTSLYLIFHRILGYQVTSQKFKLQNHTDFYGFISI